jgi:hypothetical protein
MILKILLKIFLGICVFDIAFIGGTWILYKRRENDTKK